MRYLSKAFIGLLLFAGCQKTNIPANHSFITLPTSAPPIVQQVTATLTALERHKPFWEELTTKQGTPNWDHTRVVTAAERPGDTLVIMPLIKQGTNHVHSILLAVKKQDRLRFTLLDGSKYYELGFNANTEMNASFLALELMALNHQIFGHTLFIVHDPRLFSRSGHVRTGLDTFRFKTSTPTTATQRTTIVSIYECYTTTHAGDQGQLNGVGAGGTPNYYYTEETVCTWNILLMDLGGGGSGGTVSSGTGWSSPAPTTGYGYSSGGSWYPQYPSQGPIYSPICPQCVADKPAPTPPIWQEYPVLHLELDEWYTVLGPDKPVEIKSELDCFDKNPAAKYKISINVNQPEPKSRDLYNTQQKFMAGHTFLTLIQENSPTEKKVRNVGFYPKTKAKPANEVDDAIFNDDSGTPFTVKLEFEVTPEEFDIIKASLIDAVNQRFNLVINNCTNVSLDALSKIGVNLPRTESGNILFRGINPADLGEDIRALNLNDLTRASGNRIFIRSVTDRNTQSTPARQGQ